MNNEKEIWLPIIGYENEYEISNLGRVKSLARVISHRQGTANKKERILRPLADRKGYLFVILCKEKRREHKWIARLVGIHFISNPENKPVVNHKKGNVKDNRASQLEWVTLSENTIHAYETGLQKRLLTKEQVIYIRDQKRKGATAVDIAKKFNVRYEIIVEVAANRLYKNILTWQ